MKTAIEINTAILKITLNIEENFPELSKYIAEMPITIPNNEAPEINIKILQDYYDSLYILVKDYAITHNNPSV